MSKVFVITVKLRTKEYPKPKEELFKLVEPYRRPGNELDCIVPFSGGRDSAVLQNAFDC